MTRSLFSALHRRFGPSRDASRLSRREVLEAAWAVSATLALGACAGTRRRTLAAQRVVVVGGGLSGLSSALELRARGTSVEVLEARPRVGGRVQTLHDLAPGKTVEAGGEFIGTNHPLWLAYAERFGLELAEESSDESLEAPVVLDGQRLSADESRALYEEMGLAFDELTRRAADVDADEPWSARDAAMLDREPIASWIAGLDASPLCKRAIAAQLVADNGVGVRAQSTLAHLAMIRGGGLEKYWTDSEIFRCRGGNQRLAIAMAEALGADVTSNEPVTAIEVGDRTTVITCASGRRLEADHVVLAVPPSTWSAIRFDPPLPAELAPQMGRSVKYLAAMRTRYWKTRGLSPYAFSDGDIGFTWESTADQAGDESAVLAAFSSDAAADRCRERKGGEQRRLYADAIEALLPGFADQFEAARFVDWPSDPWTRAGYSFPAPGEVTSVAPILRRGLGRLHFAGEHTSTKFPGYMEGALDSGVRVARSVGVASD